MTAINSRMAELNCVYKHRRPLHDKPYEYIYRNDENLIEIAFIENTEQENYCEDHGISTSRLSINSVEQLFSDIRKIANNSTRVMFRETFNLFDPEICNDSIFDLITFNLKNLDLKNVEIVSNIQFSKKTDPRLTLWKKTFNLQVHSIVRTFDRRLSQLCLGEELAVDSDHLGEIEKDIMTVHVLHGLPFMSKEQRIGNTLKVIDLLARAGFVKIVLEAEPIRAYSTVRGLYDLGLYESVDQSEILFIASNLLLDYEGISYRLDQTSFPDLFSYELGSIYITRNQIPKTYNFVLPTEKDVISCKDAILPLLTDRHIQPYTVWLGSNESDLASANQCFKASISNIGRGEGQNFARNQFTRKHCSVTNLQPERWLLYAQYAENILYHEPRTRFMVQAALYANRIGEQLKANAICYNDTRRYDMIRHKATFRKLFEDIVPMPNSFIINASEYSYDRISNAFGDVPDRVVVQKSFSSAGHGTYFLDPTSPLPEELTGLDENLLVSRYYSNDLSVNAHLVIFDNDVLVFPGSIQIILSETKYSGGDFSAFQKLPEKLKNQFYNYCRAIGMRISEYGYRGAVGLDALLVDDDFIFIEANARFQGSTGLLNRMLNESGLPSYHELVYESFFFEKPSISQEQLFDISNYYAIIFKDYHKDIKGNWTVLQYIKQQAIDSNSVILQEDAEVESESNCSTNTRVYALIFKEPLVEINSKTDIPIPLNLYYDSTNEYENITIGNIDDDKYLSCLSCAINSHGVRMESDIEKKLQFKINDHVFLIPDTIAFDVFSPFIIVKRQSSYYLQYFDKILAKINY